MQETRETPETPETPVRPATTPAATTEIVNTHFEDAQLPAQLRRLAERKTQVGNILAGEIDHELATRAWELLSGATDILILAHEHPDPDTLGSALGLMYALEPLGKRCVVACADPVPADFRAFLPGYERVVSELPNEDFDLVVALDAGDLTRYGSLYDNHKAFFDAALLLNMDHHVTSPGIGVCAIIDVPSAATAELLTIFLLHVGQPIPRLAADCLLAGIITDTRAFEFDATTDRTLLAGAYLVACGAIPEAIIKPMYRLKPLAKARLWGRALSAVRDTAGGRIVWAQISQTDLAAAGATSDMDDGLSTYLVDIPGVAYAALLRESLDGSTRVSLRTTAPYDAAAVCAQFDGGGHVRAAGCTLHMGLEEASQTLVAALEAALEAALISTGRSAQSPHPA